MGETEHAGREEQTHAHLQRVLQGKALFLKVTFDTSIQSGSTELDNCICTHGTALDFACINTHGTALDFDCICTRDCSGL